MDDHQKRIIAYLILLVTCVAVLFPMFWMFWTSIRPEVESSRLPPNLMAPLTLDHYEYVFGPRAFLVYIRNSAIVALGTSVLNILFSAFTAYGLTRYEFKGQNAIEMLILNSRFLSPVIIVLPLYLLFRGMGQTDSMLSLVAVYNLLMLPLNIWLLRGFFAEIPIDLDESAELDGSSRLGIFFRIVLPLALPGIIVAFIWSVIWCWNEFFIALVLTASQKSQTASIFMNGFLEQAEIRFDRMCAAGFAATLPVLALTWYVGKYLISGITAGAVKG